MWQLEHYNNMLQVYNGPIHCTYLAYVHGISRLYLLLEPFVAANTMDVEVMYYVITAQGTTWTGRGNASIVIVSGWERQRNG